MATATLGAPAEAPHVGRLGAWLRRVTSPKLGLTRAERAERAAQKAQLQALKLLKGQLDAEAEEAAHLISYALESLDICWRKEAKGKEKVRRVVFSRPFPVSEEALYLPVDLSSRRRPRGVYSGKLADDAVLEELSLVIGRKVTVQKSHNHGFFYVVWRGEGSNGIPIHVRYDDMLALRPAGAAGPLWFPLGMGEGKKPYWRELPNSLLIAGTSNGGKSNELNVILSTLINANGPHELQLALVDLKRVEFSYYRPLPHIAQYTIKDPKGGAVRKPAFASDAHEALAILEWAGDEIDRRTRLLEAVKAKKLAEYNNGRFRRDKLPYLYVVVDEWALVALSPKIGKRCVEALVKIAAVGRALGVGVIICTQYPKSDVVDTRIRAVMNGIMNFMTTSIAASVTVLGNKSAFQLSDRPGRFIWQSGTESLEVQAPLITNEKLEEVVAKATAGEQYQATMHSGPDVADQEIFEWSIRDNRGELSGRAIASQFSVRGMTIGYARKFLDRVSGTRVVVFGAEYTVQGGSAGIVSRLLPVEIPMENTAPAGPPAGVESL